MGFRVVVFPVPMFGLVGGAGTEVASPLPWADNCATVRIIPAAAPRTREKFIINLPAAPDYTLRNSKAHGPCRVVYIELTVRMGTGHSGEV